MRSYAHIDASDDQKQEDEQKGGTKTLSEARIRAIVREELAAGQARRTRQLQ